MKNTRQRCLDAGHADHEKTPTKPVTRSDTRKKSKLAHHLDEDASSFVETRSKRLNTDFSPGFRNSKRKDDLGAHIPSENSVKNKQTRSSRSKGFLTEGDYNANSKVLGNVTAKRTGIATDWILTQYRTNASPALGILKAVSLHDQRVVTFDLEEYLDEVNIMDNQSLTLKSMFRSLLLFHVVPHRGSLQVFDLSTRTFTRIPTNPRFNEESFGRLHEFKLLPDLEHESNYIIIHDQVIEQVVIHFEYRSVIGNWTVHEAQPVEDVLQLNTEDPRNMIFESGLVRCVSFNAEGPIVLSQDAEQLIHEAFAQEGVFERDEQGNRVMGELTRLWSRGSQGWFAVVESNDEDGMDLRIQGIVLFRLRGDGSRVDFISRIQEGSLPVHAYDLTQSLLEVVNGAVHLTFATLRNGSRGYLVFSFEPTTGGWILREDPNFMSTPALTRNPVFVTRLSVMPGVVEI